MNPWMKVIAALLIALAAYAAGHYVATLNGDAALAKAQAEWAKDRELIASQRADAVNARLLAERAEAQALDDAAQNYERGKADAENSSHDVVADLRSGAIRLRDQWATCQASAAAVSSAAGSGQPDEGAHDREASAGRIIRAAAQCDAQVLALQQALMGEREGQ